MYVGRRFARISAYFSPVVCNCFFIISFILSVFSSFLSQFLALYVDTNLSPVNEGVRIRRRDHRNEISPFSDLDGRKSNSFEIETSSSISDTGRYNSLNFENVIDGAASRIYKSIVVTGGNQQNHHQLWPERTLSSPRSKLLPDEIAFRPDSACSDHPSLATTSLLGMDMDSSGSQVADLETCFDSAIESATTGGGGKMFDNLSIPDQQIKEETFFENMKKFNADQNSSEIATSGTNRTKNGHDFNDTTAHHQQLNENEPHYPLAFQPQNLVVRSTGN